MNVRKLSVVCVALSLICGCGGGDEDEVGTSSGSAPSGSSGSPGGSTSSSSGSAAPLDVIDGIEFPPSLKACDEGLFPTVSPTDIAFNWDANASATQYAVRARKGPNGTDFVETFAGLQAGTSYAFGERTAETQYVIAVYAIADRTPVCAYLGVNSTTPH